jgi:hypothetical protein
VVAGLRPSGGALYDGLNQGRIEVQQLRTLLAGLPLPRSVDGRPILAVDVSPCLRPDEAGYGQGHAVRRWLRLPQNADQIHEIRDLLTPDTLQCT